MLWQQRWILRPEPAAGCRHCGGPPQDSEGMGTCNVRNNCFSGFNDCDMNESRDHVYEITHHPRLQESGPCRPLLCQVLPRHARGGGCLAPNRNQNQNRAQNQPSETWAPNATESDIKFRFSSPTVELRRIMAHIQNHLR